MFLWKHSCGFSTTLITCFFINNCATFLLHLVPSLSRSLVFESCQWSPWLSFLSKLQVEFISCILFKLFYLHCFEHHHMKMHYKKYIERSAPIWMPVATWSNVRDLVDLLQVQVVHENSVMVIWVHIQSY